MFQRQGQDMAFGELHPADEQFVCLLCFYHPDTRSFFDIYPQLLKHWGEKHGLGDAGVERRHR